MLKCDFCGRACESVLRVALDGDYDRLSVLHNKMYACEQCSKEKEEKRKSQRAESQRAETQRAETSE